MAFPKILHCLVCEDLRLERNRKATLVGFYGVAPQVQILIRNIERPIDRLQFLFLAGEGDPGNYKLSFRLLDGSEKQIGPTLEAPFVIQDKRKQSVGFGVGNIKFSNAGEHFVQLFVDSQPYYTASFEVKQGQPSDFED